LDLQKPECNKASDTKAGCFVPNITSGGKKNKMAQINIHITQLVPFLKRFLLILFLLLLLLLLSSVFYLVFIISPPCLFYFWIGHNFCLSLSLSLALTSFIRCMRFYFFFVYFETTKVLSISLHTDEKSQESDDR
jgi:hypothetical protein